MKHLIAVFVLLLLSTPPPALSVPSGPVGFQLDFLRDFDIEVAGLLDAYLEAVPECPVRGDTPIRLWVLDVAMLRVAGVLDTALEIEVPAPGDGFPAAEWEAYLQTALDYHGVFCVISETYHSDSVPDALLSIGLEENLLRADSLWREAESRLFERLAEEGYHE